MTTSVINKVPTNDKFEPENWVELDPSEFVIGLAILAASSQLVLAWQWSKRGHILGYSSIDITRIVQQNIVATT